MKRVIIVGAGIAGLTAGIYAKQSGFDVTIFESHSIPGGASTSWRRKGYYFEGGLHWLTGSGNATQLNKLWREVGALDDSVGIYNRDPFFQYELDGQKACLYRDIKKLRKHLLQLSPADKKEINRLCNDVEKFSKMEMPVMDLPKLSVKYPIKFPLSMLIRMLPAMFRMKYYQNMSVKEYSEKYHSELLRKLWCNMIGEDYSANGLLFTIATLIAGDGGYPTGGSLAMANRMAKRFEKIGGTIQYKTMVDKVLVKDGTAKGVLVANQEIDADAVIVTADALSAIDTLFEEPIHEPWAEQMRTETEPMMNVFVGLGIATDLSDIPAQNTIPMMTPFTIGNRTFENIGFNNYAGYKGYAPDGCTAVTSTLVGDTYDFWKQCRENGTYESEKGRVAKAVIQALSEKYPQLNGKVEVWDVATPLTYERYLHSYKGSWMTITKKGQQNAKYPCKPQSIANLYFAGQRLMSPGGCPVAVYTGRTAVQHLCLDTNTVFQIDA